MVLDIFSEAQSVALRRRQIGEALAARKGLEGAKVMIEPMPLRAVGVAAAP
ncbi:hypothetical protein [Accumulibacter sp.]|uniref:hypothetical protein n=1 Tax=Accumulibacter sp. TaxID=2053492 RepID=UPI002626E236|nr:hypothetical protein [Accumulibacter sp.]